MIPIKSFTSNNYSLFHYPHGPLYKNKSNRSFIRHEPKQRIHPDYDDNTKRLHTLLHATNYPRGGGGGQQQQQQLQEEEEGLGSINHHTYHGIAYYFVSVIKVYVTHLYFQYLSLIQKRPVLIKSLSCGIISCIGDLLSQYVTYVYSSSSSSSSSSSIITMMSPKKIISISNFFVSYLNIQRCIAFFMTGTFFVGPYIHYWYQFLWNIGKDWKQKYHLSQVKQVFYLNFIDQTIGVILFFPLYFFIYEYIEAFCLWRVPSIQATTQRLILELPSVLLMQYKIWPLVNWINFMYVPESMRVLVSNLVAVLWNIYLCAKVSHISC